MTFDLRLGACRLESERQTFPLTGRYARSFAAHRLALMGMRRIPCIRWPAKG